MPQLLSGATLYPAMCAYKFECACSECVWCDVLSVCMSVWSSVAQCAGCGGVCVCVCVCLCVTVRCQSHESPSLIVSTWHKLEVIACNKARARVGTHDRKLGTTVLHCLERASRIANRKAISIDSKVNL